MLKKLIASALVLSVAALSHASDAGAEPPKVMVAPANQAQAQVAQAAISKAMVTMIKGDIVVPQTFSGSGYGSAASLNGFQCSNLVIIATSKDQKPKPPNWDGFFWDAPVWTRSQHATGTWSSGHCSYMMIVPGDSQFKLEAGDTGQFNCSYININLTNTPAWQSVPKGTAKTDNLTVTKVECGIIG